MTLGSESNLKALFYLLNCSLGGTGLPLGFCKFRVPLGILQFMLRFDPFVAQKKKKSDCDAGERDGNHV